MAYQTWFAFFLAACVIAISPGSGAVLSMSHGLNYGLRRTTATILGLEIALVVVLIIAGAGVGSLLVASETAFNVVKIAGALYLIYLGFSQWRARVPSEQEGEALDNANAVARAQRGQHWWQRCMTGFLTNATNPKGIVFMDILFGLFLGF